MRRLLGKLLPARVLGVLATFSEACGRVGRAYGDIAAAQRGETHEYAVGAWLTGVTRTDFERLLEVLPQLREGGVWDALPQRRHTLTVMLVVEAPNAHRAAARSFDVLTGYFDQAGVEPEAVRVEVDGVLEGFGQ